MREIEATAAVTRVPAQEQAQEQVRQLIELAQYFAYEHQYNAAAELLALALQLNPLHAQARARLDAVRRAQRQGSGREARSLQEAAWEEFRASAVEGAHFVGLARLYLRKGEIRRSLECLEIAEAKSPNDPAAPKFQGQILYRQGSLEDASHALERALLLDPFDREAAEALGLVEYRRGELAAAAAATVHAFLLLGELESDEAIRLRGRLMTLKRLLHWEAGDFQSLFRERRQLLHGAYDRLEWHRERFFEEESLPRGGALFGIPPRKRKGGVLDIAVRLRGCEACGGLEDDHLFQLTSTMQEELHERGSLIFGHEAVGRDVYLVELGEVRIERPTPYGTHPLRTIGPGGVFGEVGYLSGRPRSGDAVAARACRLLRLDARALDTLLESHLDLAGQFLWSLWHALAGKLRGSNDQLLAIFHEVGGVGKASPPPQFVRPGGGEQVIVAAEDKTAVWREAFQDTNLEQVLSAQELTTLAAFSRERRFNTGDYLFREGDAGDELYAVVEGRVLISKYIPGGGDEALAILGRGEFFGEMALIEGKPRSADARAEGGPVTVLTLDHETVHQLFTLDAAASLEFIRLLCRLLTRRLREVEEKVLTWRIMIGGWGEEYQPDRAAP